MEGLALLVTKRRRPPPEVEKLFNDARHLGAGEPRKHHLVPAFYLRRWAENGQIRVTDVNDNHDYKTSPNKAARQTDFYRMEVEEVDRTDFPPLLFELLLGHTEQWGKRAIGELVQAPVELSPKIVAEFAWYLAMQFNRGAAFRTEMHAMTTEFFKLQYAGLSDEGIRRELRSRGVVPTDELVAESRKLFDGLKEGSIVVSPQQGASMAWAGEAARDIGEHFLTRTWVVFESPPVMLTCDEPIVLIGGPGLPRDERAGVATAAAVALALDPSHVLVLFRDDVAERLGATAPPTHVALGQLDPVETTELCREVAMNAHRWIFERPGKRVGARLQIPAAAEAFSVEDVGAPRSDGAEMRQLIRTFKKNRWYNATSPAPWPVSRWWQ